MRHSPVHGFRLARERPLAGLRFPDAADQPFTPHQARAAGVTQHTFEKLVRSGHLRRVLRGVYSAAQAPDDVLMRASALALVIPPTAVVTDRTAAWLHGVEILPRTALTQAPPIDVAHVDDTRVRRPEVDGRRRGLLRTDITEVHGVRVTTALRTALDLGRLLWRFDALAAIDGFLRIGVPHELLIRRSTGSRAIAGSGSCARWRHSVMPALSRRGNPRCGCTGTTRGYPSRNCRSGSTPTRAHPSIGWTSPTRRFATPRSTTVRRCTRRSTTGSTTSPADCGSRTIAPGRSIRFGRKTSTHAMRTRSHSCRPATPRRVGASACGRHVVVRPEEVPARRPEPRETAPSAPLSHAKLPARRPPATRNCPVGGTTASLAAGWSSHQVRCSAVMPRAGVCWTEPSSARARATASALPSPATTNQTSRVRLRAAKVRVIRSGGGFGEPVTGTAMAVGVELGEAREQRGDVPVRAEAQQDQVELAAAVRPQLLFVRRSGRCHVRVRLVGGRHRVHPRRVCADHVEQVQLDAAVVAVAGVGRHVALVAPPEVHLRPVHCRRVEPREGTVDLVGDGPAGQRDRGHPALGLDAAEPVEQLLSHRARQRLGVRNHRHRIVMRPLTRSPASRVGARSRRTCCPRPAAAAPRPAARARPDA